MKGQLPKAYLRMDPDLDAKHPDNLAEFIRMMCAANRQPWRGRFRSRAVLEAIVGKAATKRAIDRGDLIPAGDHECRHCPPGEAKAGELYLDGWDTWQEGDLTVSERMRGYRARRNGTRNAAVTEPVTPGVTHVLRQQGNKASVDDDPQTPDELELATDDLLAPSQATPKQLRAMRGFARVVGTERVLVVLHHWVGQKVEDRFTGAFEQLQSEADATKAGKKRPSKWDYMDESSGGAAA